MSAAVTAYLVWPSPRNTSRRVVPFSDLSDPLAWRPMQTDNIYISDYRRDRVPRYDVSDTNATTALPFTGLSRLMRIASTQNNSAPGSDRHARVRSVAQLSSAPLPPFLVCGSAP